MADEVQEMLLGDLEKLNERLAASTLRAILRVSTANFAGGDINYFYERSDQREFHTRCGGCADGVVLTECWDPKLGPLCIDRGNGSTPSVPTEHFFVCPKCRTILRDPHDGQFVAHQPGVGRVGFHWGQMLSPRQTAASIMEKWLQRVTTGVFYQRVLGLPYADPDTQPITEAVLEAAQNPELRWGKQVTTEPVTYFCGIDQMGHDNHVVVTARAGDRIRLVHLEIVEGDDPWRRCAEIMREYRVRACAVEALPNFNEAHRFAKAFPGKVFVVQYQDLKDDMVLWGDRSREKVTIRETEDEAKTLFTATVDQYKMMSFAFGRWTAGEVETPDARALVQEVRTDRGRRTVAICHDVFWAHLQRVALVTEYREGA